MKRYLGLIMKGCLLFVFAFALVSNSAFAFDLKLDDFDGSKIVSLWWMTDPAAPYVYTLDPANTEHVQQGSHSMKVVYNKANDSNAYSSFAAKGYYNLKDYDYLSFWTYNDGSALNFNIRFEDVNGGAMELSWAGLDFPARVTSSAGWENLTVDLSRLTYAQDVDWTKVTQIIFMVAPGSSSASGTFWMDDLKLSRAPNSASLEPFEADNFSWYGGGVFANNLSVVSSQFHNDGSYLGNHSMSITWGTKGSGWDSVDYLPAEITANTSGRIGNYPNFTLNSNYQLEAWIKSTTDNNIPILLKFMTDQNNGQDISTQTYTGNGSWQKLTWNYSGKSSASSVYQAKFMIYPGQSDNGGTLYIDDINLTGGTPPVTPNPPTGLTSNADNPDLDGGYTVSWTAVSGASNYQLQEANNENFTDATDYYPSGTYINISKNPNTEKGKYQYRVRTNLSGNYGSFSAPIVVTVGTNPTTPTLTVPSADYNGNYLVEWTDVGSSGATIYELIESTSSDFSTNVNNYWPTLANNRMFNYTNGTYYYKVRAWTAVPEHGGLSSGWSSAGSCTVTMTATRPGAPTLKQMTDADADGIFKVMWSDESATGATHYEVWESTASDFSQSVSFFWPQANFVWIDKSANGTFYYKARSWTDVPENDGISSEWSTVKSITVTLNPVSMSYNDLKTAAFNLAQSPFVPPAVQPIKLDDFEENSLTGSPSGLRWTDDGSSAYQYSISSDQAVNNYSIKVIYAKSAAYQYFIGNIDNSVFSDFTRHSRVTLSSYGQVPILLELEDNLGRIKQVSTQTPGTVNAKGWSTAAFDYDSLRGLQDFDLTNVKKLRFCITPGNSSASGTIYLDMIGQDTPVPQLDWPPDSVPTNTGLVYQEANLIKGSQVIDDGNWWAVLKPRSARVYEMIDNVYVYKNALSAYVEKGYDFNDFDYSDPHIVPPIDFNAQDMQASWKWHYLVQFQLGHKYIMNGNDLFPEVYEIVGSAYQKIYGYPPIMGGASFRPLLHSFDATLGEESYPRLKKLYIKKIDANTINLLCLIDSDSVTAAMSINVTPGLQGVMDVQSTTYTRRAINLTDNVGIAGFSTMYFLGEESTDGLEAHDSDNLTVGYEDGKSIDYRIPQHYAPEGNDDKYENFFGPRGSVNINHYALEEQDQWAGHYMPWIEANYDRRSSYSVDINANSTPFKMRLWQHGTFNEYDDNVVASLVPTTSLAQSTSVNDGITLDYTMKSYFPVVALENAEDDDLAPRDTALTWASQTAGIYTISTSSSQAHGGTYSKRVVYAKTSADQYFTAQIDPNNQIRKGDLSESNTFVAWVYGNVGPIQVDFLDTNGHRMTIGTATADNPTGWKELDYNYNALRNENIDLTHIDKIIFLPNPGSANASGTFYIDDVATTTIDTFPGTPFLYDPGALTVSGKYNIRWPKCGGAGIMLNIPIGGSTQGLYEIQEDVDSNFSDPTTYWPNGQPLSLTKTTNGTYYYRCRSWTAAPDDGGISSNWSDVVHTETDLSYPVFDNFDGLTRVDTWWESDGTDVYERSVSSEQAHDGTKSMKIIYHKSGKPWSYFAAKPLQNEISNDLSEFSSFNFWVYGSVSLLVKFEDNGGGSWEHSVSTSSASAWEQVQIDLTQATGVNMSDIRNVMFFVAPGDGSSTGTFYMDEFTMAGNSPVVIYEDFENNSVLPLTWQGLDGALNQGVPAVYTFTTESDPSPDYVGDDALKVDFHKRNKYNFLQATIESGNRRNFTSKNTLVVWVYGQATMLAKLEDSNGVGQDIGIRTATDTGWNQLLFNYAHLTNNLSSISKILLCVEPDSGSASGTIYLDDIGLKNTAVASAPVPDLKSVDNFDGSNIADSWWDNTAPPSGPFTRDVANTEHVHGGSRSMKVAYNKQTGQEWEYFGMGVNYLQGDFRPYKQISFWLYGNVNILVKLRDQSNNQMEIGTVSNSGGAWQQVFTADFAKLAAHDATYFQSVRATLFPNFSGTAADFFAANSIDMSQIKDVLLFPKPGQTGVSGSFWMDDIQLIAKDDVTPPSAISDLSASTGTRNGEVDLAWTAPGDDGDIGTATSYIIKYNTSAITDNNWASSTEIAAEPKPRFAGTPETFIVTGLSAGNSYYFAIKAVDDANNISAISNVPQAQAKRTFPTTVSVPSAAWKIDLGTELANPGVSGFKDYGYWNGVPVGGFSGGAFQRSFNGDFNLWYLHVGMDKFETIPANQFSVYMKPASGDAVSRVLWNWHPSDSYQGTLSSWNWNYPNGAGTYYALYPKAWTAYTDSEFPARIVCEQFSPIIANNYQETGLPVGIFKWTAENPTSENVTVSVMFTWENMVGWDYYQYPNGWRNSTGNFNYAATDGDVSGVVLSSTAASPVTQPMEGQFAIAAKQVSGVTVTYKSTFNANGNGSDVWTQFSNNGTLDNSDDQPVAGSNDAYGAAVCVTFTLAPSQSITFPMAIAWDFPIMEFGQDESSPTYWYQYYTKIIQDKGWVTNGKTGKNAFVIAKQALNNYSTWEGQIDTWQSSYLSSNRPDWYKSSLLNQLYYMVMGGTAWENGLVSGQTGKYDDPNDYKFAMLENADWKNYNPVDVRFYGSFPLAMLWPDLEKSVLEDISNGIHTTDSNFPPDLDGATPHDFSDPRHKLWQAYNIHGGNGGIATTDWKDLPTYFTLMVYRYYVLTGKTDTAFLNYCWPSVKMTLNRLKNYDTDNDGLPNHVGTDTTYDTWAQYGASSYAGGLLLTSLRAAQAMADIVGDTQAKQDFTDWFNLAQPNYEAKLWNGQYYKYCTEGGASNDIMADQLSGQMMARTLDLPGIVPNDHAVSALNTVYNYNIMGIANGERGAMNGVMPDGTIEQRAQQSQEVWTGVTYAVAASMIYEGMEDKAMQAAWGIYHTVYEDKGYWFRVPEAWYVDGDFRGGVYYRPMGIWAMELAFEKTASPDTTAPATITNLAASAGGANGSVQLTWTAPGDDGTTGTASTYVVKYSESQITSENDWENATTANTEPLPKPAGASESFTVTGLIAGQTYYFAIKTQDEAMNSSGLSNSPYATATTDSTAPAAITDLRAATGGDYGYVNLSWTAPGDDGNTGTATKYIVRYSTIAITTDGAWDQATDVTSGIPAPSAAGTAQNMTVTGLTVGQAYYFAIKTQDETPNTSPLSNTVSANPGLATGKVFENFDGNSIVYAWWDNISPPTGPYTRTPADTTHVYDGSHSMKVVYNKAVGQEWEYFGAGETGDNQNFQGYSKLSFWVYGNVHMMVKLRDTANNEAEVGTISTTTSDPNDWEQLSTGDFAGLSSVDLAHIKDVLFFVEPGVADISGTFWIDGMRLVPNIDATAPAAVTDLSATTGIHYGQVTLNWTAPGDDGNTGTATKYIVKCSSSSINSDAAWASATNVNGAPVPQVAGTAQSMVINGLTGGQTYYFAIKTQDELLNTSALSNSPSAVPSTVAEKMIDNFDGNSILSSWWDHTSPPSGPYTRTPADTAHTHDGSHAMKVVYDKQSGQEWEYFGAAPNTSERDFTDYAKISFWVYGNVDILLKLRDVNDNEAEIGTVTTATSSPDDWEELISLDFSNISGVDKAHIKDILFFVRPGLSGVSGTFWIDEIRLTNAPTVNRPPSVTVISPNGGEVWWGTHNITWQAQDPDAGDSITDITLQYTEGSGTNQVLVEDFDDAQDDPNNAGGSANTWTQNSGTITASFNNTTGIPYRGTGYSKQLTYNVSANDSEAGYWLGLNNRDLTNYEDVSFLIKGAAGGEILEVGLKDASPSALEKKLLITDYLPGGVTTGWKLVTIPLADFINVDKGRIDNVSFTFLNSLGTPATGTVYIDEVRFLKWVNIATGESNDGTYSWNTAGYPDGTRYLIRVLASDGELTGKDECDDYFCPVGPDVTVTSPNGSENWSGTETVNWTATYGDPIDSVSIQYSTASSRKIVDDFNDGSDPNLLGGGTGTWTKSGGTVSTSYNSSVRRGSSGYGYQIDYAVSTPDDEAGYWTGLNSQDVSRYQEVSFWIKGSNGEEKVKAGLKDNNNNETKLLVNNYLPEGKITTSWQQVVIPLADFFSVANWGSMGNFSLTFNNGYGSPYSGTVYIDDIRFARWTDIVTGLSNSGSYSWDTTNVADDSTYLARVIAYSAGISGKDESDAVFTVANGSGRAVASSSENSGLTADKAVDDNMSTRWASAATNNEWIYVDLGAVKTFDTVKLFWEAAYASSYEIQTSNNASTWTTIYTNTSGAGGNEVIYVGDHSARYVKMKGNARGTQYGYSLWEIQVLKAYASSIEGSGSEAYKATDGNGSTRWASGSTDNEWIYIDNMWSRAFDAMKLNWEAAYGHKYELQVSNDATNWTTIYEENNSDGGEDNLSAGDKVARYIRMKGVQRATQWGYSLWEFKTENNTP